MVADCTDFVVYGEAECEDGQLGALAARRVLLTGYHNPRRNLVEGVTLSSNNSGCTDFVMTSGADTLCSKDLVSEGYTPPRPNVTTDFVVYGEAEYEDGQVGASAARHALLASGYHNPRRNLVEGVTLSSNNSGCTDFFMSGEEGVRCSKELSSADLLWVEGALALKPGTLFQALREPASSTELPWEPAARYRALAKQAREGRKRGAKSVAHLKNLRQSDPTINLSGWIDWRALYEHVDSSPMAALQRQAEINRAMRPERVRLSYLWKAQPDGLRVIDVSQSGAGEAASEGRDTRAAEETGDIPAAAKAKEMREERRSADSVISFLDEHPTSPSSVLTPQPGGELSDYLSGKEWTLDAGAGAKGKHGLDDEVVWFEGRAYSKRAVEPGAGYSSS